MFCNVYIGLKNLQAIQPIIIPSFAPTYSIVNTYKTGADPAFSLVGGGGGTQKMICPHAHYERVAELIFGKGCRELYGTFTVLSCYLRLIF